MEQHGFIHSKMDVKILILYVMARLQYPVDVQQLYELCYQDDCLSYFDLREVIPELVSGGHLAQAADQTLSITDKGRETGAAVEDSLAIPVARRAGAAVEKFNRAAQRSRLIQTEILEREGGDYAAVMGLDDDRGRLMTLELIAPTRSQARRLAATFQDRAEHVFQAVMSALLDGAED